MIQLVDILNSIAKENGIGLDTQVVLSIAFPTFLLLVEYVIYLRKIKRI
jgi:hypothetical protein